MCCVVFFCLCADGIIPYAYAAIAVYVMSYDLSEVHLVSGIPVFCTGSLTLNKTLSSTSTLKAEN
jgi:hypothetical protein